MSDENKENKEKKEPVLKIKVGGIQAAVFENEATNKDKEVIKYQNVTLQKSWTTDNGKTWENKKLPLNMNEVANAILALQEVIRQQKVIVQE